MEFMLRMQDKVALVTGAAGGIGGEICRKFLAEGAKVLALDVVPGAAEQLVADLGAGDRAVGMACDVSQVDQVSTSVDKALSAFGGLNVLCNVAGGSSTRDGRVTEAPIEEFWRVMNVDLFGTFLVCKFGIPALIAAGGGSVINFSSITALMALPERDCYTAAKGGIASMTRSMALGFAPDNVRVNAIAPGKTTTPRTAARAHTERAKKVAERCLLGVLEPSDIAHMAVFLASDESTHITGQVFAVDSGITIS
jgi:NAD(P)-dependent dehydrogenase (short-subunit alcohol dehydrogenase family)